MKATVCQRKYPPYDYVSAVRISKLAVTGLVSLTNLMLSYNGNNTPFIHSDVQVMCITYFETEAQIPSAIKIDLPHYHPSDVHEHRHDCGGRLDPWLHLCDTWCWRHIRRSATRNQFKHLPRTPPRLTKAINATRSEELDYFRVRGISQRTDWSIVVNAATSNCERTSLAPFPQDVGLHSQTIRKR